MSKYTTDVLGRRVPTTRNRGMSTSDRFDAQGWDVTSKGCWEWRGSRNDKGYGRFSYAGGQLAHRYALERKLGMPLRRSSALHECDNPPCVSPEHLKEGTHDENMRQAAERRRLPQAKLTPDEVLDIKDRLGVDSVAGLAREYSVCPATIRAIREGRNWSWIDREGE